MDEPPGSNLAGTRSESQELPSSQVLFSDEELPDHDAIQGENSLFPDQATHPPRRRKRIRRRRARVPAANVTSSSDDEQPPKRLSLKEIFQNYLHKREKWRRRREKKLKKPNENLPQQTEQKRKVSKPRKKVWTLPLAQRKKRMKNPGARFPFLPSKYQPFDSCLFYEQSFVNGFLNYMKKIKSEKHLKTSLNKMGVSKDVEEEIFETRKHRFLDEEESLSSISESGDFGTEFEDRDAVIVENESFILDCRIPSKKEWQMSNRMKPSSKKRKKKHQAAD